MNLSGLCVEALTPNCLTGNQNDYRSDSLPGNTGLSLFVFPYGQGCALCETDYVSIQLQRAEFVCTVDQQFNVQPFIDQCSVYGVLGASIVCAVCNAGFLPIVDRSSCVEITDQLANCLVPASATECQDCANNYVLLNNGQCVL